MPTDREDQDVRAELRAWVRDRAALGPGADITDRTPLFNGGLLRSVHLPELLLVLERLRGALIDVEELEPGDFRDIDTLIERFAR